MARGTTIRPNTIAGGTGTSKPSSRVIAPPTQAVPEAAGNAGAEPLGGSLLRGTRAVKEYYIYDNEFRELKRVGGLATALFAIGSAIFGFVINTHLGIVFADHLSDDIRAQWIVYRNIGIAAGVLCYFFAILQSLVGYNLVERIKAETSHGTEKYLPKSRYKIALWALVFAAFGTVGFVVRPWIW